MQKLPPVKGVQNGGQLVISQAVGIGEAMRVGGYMIGGFIDRVPFLGENNDLPEEGGIDGGNGPQGLQVAGASGLQVYQITGHSGDDGVDAELVRAGVNAELVGSQGPDDGHVPDQVGLEQVQVAYIVHSLLKPSHVAWSQAYPSHAQPLQLAGHEEMLLRRGRRLRLIHRHFQLEILSGCLVVHPLDQVTIHNHRMSHRSTILGHSA